MLTYQEIRRDVSPEKARGLVKKILEKNNGDVSETARILATSRKTVRRARDGTLEDKSRKPNNSPNKTESSLEGLIIQEGKNTGYRYRRLTGFLFDKYGLEFSEETVKAILKRNHVPRKKIRTRNGRVRHLYDYEHLEPFAKMQLDTKHILDYGALPKDVYMHILKHKLPLYEWNIIDVVTKMRFTAYSYELSQTLGWQFIFMVVSWLRVHGIRDHINIQADNGGEFCGGHKQKEIELNIYLDKWNCSFSSIPAGKKYLQGIVENSHRHDDEQFLAIHPIRCKITKEFMGKAQSWQDTWNFSRRSWGIGMNGKTPVQKLQEKNNLISTHIAQFPTILLDDIFKLTPKTGTYVPTNYPFFKKLKTALIDSFMVVFPT
jgi:hypothetical protein